MVRIAQPLAAAAMVALASAQQCLDKYQCIFHTTVGSTEYSWDLHNLCVSGGEYQVPLGGGQYIAFNICGNTTSMCSYADTVTHNNLALYDSRGAAIQFLQGYDATKNLIQPVTLSGQACPADHNYSCYDWDNYPAVTDASVGGQGCCTEPCEVVATDYFLFSVMNPNNPTSGVRFRHSSLGSLGDDPFKCGFDSTGVLQIERQLTIELTCDNGGSMNTLSNIQAKEVTTCHYLITAATKAACGVKGDPFSGAYNDDPGHSFGFVVLGATICLFVQIAWGFADKRGWTDPITSRIPPLIQIPVIGSIAQAMGATGGYTKSTGVSAQFSNTAATPITASAYGSA